MAGGTALVLALVVLPVVYWGALEAMITETVLVPLLVGDEGAPLDHLRIAVLAFGGSLPVALVGTVGIATAAWWRPRATWWLVADTLWFVVAALRIDLHAAPDLFPLLAFLAIGIGALLGVESGRQRPAAVILAVIAGLSVVTMGGFGFAPSTLYEPDPVAHDPTLEPEPPYGSAEEAHLYWEGIPPETCRVFYGPTQSRLVELTGQTANQDTCGHAGPAVEALLARWGGG